MQLSKTDKTMLINAVQKNEQAIGWRYGRVFASSLEKKRQFNSLMKLKKLGLIDAKVVYQHQNGYHDPYFGRLWCKGFSWNEISGNLTEKGLQLANSLLAESN